MVSCLGTRLFCGTTPFFVRNYINSDIGFFYAIKNDKDEIKGYLYGTVHLTPKHWTDLNESVTKKMDECRKVMVECCEIQTNTQATIMYNLLDVFSSVDLKIIEYAQTKSIALAQFETVVEQKKIISDLIKAECMDGISNFNFCCSRKKEKKDTLKFLDWLIVNWQLGNEDEAANLYSETGEISKKILEKSYNERNTEWRNKILDELKHTEQKPIFIAVGFSHLFDIKNINAVGLKTLLTNEGWKIERIQEGS